MWHVHAIRKIVCPLNSRLSFALLMIDLSNYGQPWSFQVLAWCTFLTHLIATARMEGHPSCSVQCLCAFLHWSTVGPCSLSLTELCPAGNDYELAHSNIAKGAEMAMKNPGQGQAQQYAPQGRPDNQPFDGISALLLRTFKH